MFPESWKDVVGYEGLYQVSSQGKVRNARTKKLLKPVVANGYLRVQLYAKGSGKTHYIHRLVALAFIPNPKSKPQVNHIDEDKTNNSLDNLEWSTAKDNIQYGTGIERGASHRSQPVGQYTLDGRLIGEWDSMIEAQEEGGFDYRGISKVCSGKQKTHGGFIWKKHDY